MSSFCPIHRLIDCKICDPESEELCGVAAILEIGQVKTVSGCVKLSGHEGPHEAPGIVWSEGVV